MKKKTKILLSSLATVPFGVITITSITSCSLNTNLLNNLSPGYVEDDKAAFINNNTISLLFNILPDFDLIQTKIDTIFKNNSNLDPKAYTFFTEYIQKKKTQGLDEQKIVISGNGWIINYEEAPTQPQTPQTIQSTEPTELLNKYYVLTNSHVCNLFYRLEYGDIVLKFPWKYFKNVDIKIKQSYTGFGVNDPVDYQINDFKQDSIINIGQQNNSLPYDYYLSNGKQKYLITENNQLIDYNSVTNQLKSSNAVDASIIELNVDPKKILSPNVRKMFSTDLSIFIKKDEIGQIIPILPHEKTIIYRLKESLQDLQNNDKNGFKSKFPFKKLETSYKNKISIAGYQSSKQNGMYYINWTGFTTDISAINPLAPISRTSIEYSSLNGIVVSKYSVNNNCCILGTHLTNGSSGSMVVDDDYNIIGLHWGSSSDNLYSQFIPLYKSYLTPYYDGKSLMEMIFDLFWNNPKFNNSVMFKILEYLK